MQDIYRIIKSKFNLEIPIFIMNVFELEDILNNTPKWWSKKENANKTKFHEEVQKVVKQRKDA